MGLWDSILKGFSGKEEEGGPERQLDALVSSTSLGKTAEKLAKLPGREMRAVLDTMSAADQMALSPMIQFLRRGIIRDHAGRIIRTPEWMRGRINLLLKKKEDFSNRIRNIDKEVAVLKEKLENG